MQRTYIAIVLKSKWYYFRDKHIDKWNRSKNPDAKAVNSFQRILNLGEISKGKIPCRDLKMKRVQRNTGAWRKFWESRTFWWHLKQGETVYIRGKEGAKDSTDHTFEKQDYEGDRKRRQKKRKW